MIAVSACLAGRACRYDGASRPDAEIVALLEQGRAICICPECLGGLPTPRTPAEIVGGDGADVLMGRARVMSRDGRDVSAAFLRGAREALAMVRTQGIERAVLKARSPSCGAGEIYDGTFSGGLRIGDGVTAALFKAEGIEVQAR